MAAWYSKQLILSLTCCFNNRQLWFTHKVTWAGAWPNVYTSPWGLATEIGLSPRSYFLVHILWIIVGLHKCMWQEHFCFLYKVFFSYRGPLFVVLVWGMAQDYSRKRGVISLLDDNVVPPNKKLSIPIVSCAIFPFLTSNVMTNVLFSTRCWLCRHLVGPMIDSNCMHVYSVPLCACNVRCIGSTELHPWITAYYNCA